jgi:uncharacterized damage-inducible protein DinB
MHSITDLFVKEAILTIEENTQKIKTCLAEFDDTSIWKRPNQASNSVGNIVLHLCGNITQYILSSLGGQDDKRERDKEFAAQDGFTKQALLAKLDQTISTALKVISDIKEDELLRVRPVQVYQRSGVSIIFHVAEHYSYHTGQIIFWTKLLRDKDLGFYAHLNPVKKVDK